MTRALLFGLLAVGLSLLIAIVVGVMLVLVDRHRPPPSVRSPLLSERERYLLERRWRRHLAGPDKESCLTPLRRFGQADEARGSTHQMQPDGTWQMARPLPAPRGWWARVKGWWWA